MDPAVGSGYAFILWPIANGEEITKGTIKELDRLGVEAVDAHTLKVTLKAPTPYFLGMLTHPHAYPVHPKTLERHGDKWTRAGNLVSNGAYRLTEWVPQSQHPCGAQSALLGRGQRGYRCGGLPPHGEREHRAQAVPERRAGHHL